MAFVEDLVGAGVLNRADDAIPTRAELLASPQRERGLPRPLLAVLLGHTKMWAFQMVMETAFPDSPAGRPFLDGYFPRRLQRSFAEHFQEHTLRREIVATAAVNHVVNNAGVTFLSRTTGATQADLEAVLEAYLRVEREADALALREKVLVAGLPASSEHELLLEMEEGLEALTGDAVGGKRVEGRRLDPIRARVS